MAVLSPTIDQLRTVIAGVWTDARDAGGILEAEHADMIAWADLLLPYAVILIEDLPRYDGPVDGLWYEPTAEIYYVARVAGGSSGIRIKLEALKAVFWPTDPLTEAQVLDVSGMSWAAWLRPNVVLRDKNVSARAGMLALRLLVQE